MAPITWTLRPLYPLYRPGYRCIVCDDLASLMATNSLGEQRAFCWDCVSEAIAPEDIAQRGEVKQ